MDMTQCKIKLILSKKTPKIMDNFSDRLTLEGAGGQTDDTRSTFWVNLKTLGYDGSNWLCGRSVAFWESTGNIS